MPGGEPALEKVAGLNVTYIGYTGEALHVYKCDNVIVRTHDMSKMDHCYNELPVVFAGREMWLQANTRLLLTQPTITKCK